MSEELNGDMMKNIIIGLVSIILGAGGMTAVSGGNDTTATVDQTNKIEKNASVLHKIDKNTAVTRIKVDNIEYELRKIDMRVTNLEKESHKKK